MDYFEGYIHVSDISNRLETYIKENPRHSDTFDSMWRTILNKLYWAWTKCKYIDLNLRQPDFWIRLIGECQYPLYDIAVVFKADNNGTVYAVMLNTLGTHKLVETYLYHEFECEWELEKQHN